jgi:hypothetical protein
MATTLPKWCGYTTESFRDLNWDSSLWPKQVLKPADNDVTCKIWGFHSPAAKDSRILGCDTVPLGTSLPVFWRILLPSSPKIKHPRTPLKKINNDPLKREITHQRYSIIPHNDTVSYRTMTRSYHTMTRSYHTMTWCHTTLLSWRWQRKW